MTNIGDVARHLGVSRSTVSYALSGKRPVSTEMKARIDAAIRELDYWPSAAGLSLATSRRNIIGLLAPLGENATPSVALQFVDGVARSSRTHGFDTLLVTGREAFEGVERLVRAGVVDGLVALDVENADPRLAELEGASLPAVLLGQPARPVQLDTVDMDWEVAGATLVRHLAELGHRRALVLGAPEAAYTMEMTYAVRFRAGVTRAASEADVEITEIPVGNDFSASLTKIHDALVGHNDVTGVIVQHEAAAAPLLAAAGALRLRIPEDLAVAGITLDVVDHALGRPLTGVGNPSVAMTRTAVDLLVERIVHADAVLPPRAVVVDGGGEVIDRGTTAPAPHAAAQRRR